MPHARALIALMRLRCRRPYCASGSEFTKAKAGPSSIGAVPRGRPPDRRSVDAATCHALDVSVSSGGVATPAPTYRTSWRGL